jgi:hypothetical protein
MSDKGITIAMYFVSRGREINEADSDPTSIYQVNSTRRASIARSRRLPFIDGGMCSMDHPRRSIDPTN